MDRGSLEMELVEKKICLEERKVEKSEEESLVGPRILARNTKMVFIGLKAIGNCVRKNINSFMLKSI